MDLRLLKTFLRVADSGSFSAAAGELHCVQSNVTARIRQLEQHLGQPVFDRGRGGARLTGFGERLMAHARDLVARFEAAERDLLDAAGAAAPLSLGAMETTAAVRLPGLLQQLKQRCPTAPVSLRTAPSGELQTLLWERRLDMAFIAGPVDENRFRGVPAFLERLVRVTPRAGETGPALLAFGRGCSYRAQGESWLRASGRADVEVVEMGSMEGILGCVLAGMGFALAPESAVRRYRDLDALRVDPLPEGFDDIPIHLVWRLDHRLSRAGEGLCDLLAEQA